MEIPWFVEDLRLYSPAELVEWQEGYRWHALTGAALPDWDPHWIVIGDASGDPVIARTDAPGTPVYMAVHGIGAWEPYPMSPDLATYLMALGLWIEVCVGGHKGQIRGEDSRVRNEVRSEVDARLQAIPGWEYRQHWLPE